MSKDDIREQLRIIRELCAMQREFHLKQDDVDELFQLVQSLSSAAPELVPVNRNGRLATALKNKFLDDHPVWSYVKWGRRANVG